MMLRTGSYLQDRYEILEQIGSGGMSEVYKAIDHKLNRPVAIKVLKEEYCGDSGFVDRFRMEAQSAAGLMHPNIVNVYDVVDEGDIHYIVMELIEGITLKDYIAKRGHLDIKESIGIAIQVAEGIAAAHEQNIIHRDIKPQNMLIAMDGKVKVADFGIARPVSSQTVDSAAMGSVHYISPEQARGGLSDERSDIYSLGITMYEMVTGRLPFDGTSTVAIALSHIEDAMVPPSVYNTEIPSALERIILKCCEKKPERRYQNINALISDLREVLLMPDEDESNTDKAPGTVIAGVIPVAVADNGETRKISEEEMAIIDQATRELEENDKAGQDANGRASSNTVNETPFHETSGQGARQNGNGTRNPSSGGADRGGGQGGSGRNGGGGSRNGGGNRNGGYSDYDDEEEEHGPRFEHLFAAAGIAAAVIVIVILVAVFMRLGGVFQAGADLMATESAAETEEESDADDLAGTEVYLPDVTGMSQDEAADTLNASSLNVKYIYEASDTVEEGNVIRQEPEAGSVALRWSDVTIVVSEGSDMIDLTTLGIDLLTAPLATELLESQNLSVITLEVNDDLVPEGYVVSYAPALADPGSTITLTVSMGPLVETVDLEMVQVPDITGLTEEDAIALLAESGLYPGITELEYSDTVERGIIISQSGDEDGMIVLGGMVDYVISAGPEEGAYLKLSDQRYVASINDTYELKNLIGPGAGTTSVTILIRLHQNTNGTDIYEELTGPKTVTGDVIVPISYTSIESLNGTDEGEVEVVNADTGEVLASYPLTFFPMD